MKSMQALSCSNSQSDLDDYLDKYEAQTYIGETQLNSNIQEKSGVEFFNGIPVYKGQKEATSPIYNIIQDQLEIFDTYSEP